MKKTALFAALVALASPVVADDAYGTWQTTKDDNGNYGHIQVEACGADICGTLVKSFSSDGNVLKSENVGKKIIWGMSADGNGAYSGGKIWSPDRDKTYKSKMQLTGNTLKVQGCVLVVCRDGGTWTRVK
ncbi:hypothetical protein GCM10007939_09000 [Amylibacter marinus]|uniref:DUF2147 domain-containing protein n=1 Tax=Amylibacter marinus TaxID=1475483 RepID=A0ABQ5VT52_9RHOB|nr:DUF2147 domain-containing protein [Amylibacter marinus]GLQ34617.1 hypothetical protein GCM10007939_09000 [Amylibacter marinus]